MTSVAAEYISVQPTCGLRIVNIYDVAFYGSLKYSTRKTSKFVLKSTFFQAMAES
jgi:hypothetical protein